MVYEEVNCQDYFSVDIDVSFKVESQIGVRMKTRGDHPINFFSAVFSRAKKYLIILIIALFPQSGLLKVGL